MFLMGIIVVCLSTVCIAQNENGSSSTTSPAASSPTSSKSTLESLEDIGISLLSSILSPSTTATSSSSPTSSSTSPAQTAISTTSDPTTSSTNSAAAAAAAVANANSHTTRNIIIILATVLGTLLIALIALLIWFCFRRSNRNIFGRRAVTPLDDGEIMSWRKPQEQRQNAYGPLLYEPQAPPQAATAYNAHPSQQFQSHDPFADPSPGQCIDAPAATALDVAEQRNSIGGNPKPTNWDLVEANNYRPFRHSDGYAPIPIHNHPFQHHEHSTSSLPERVPTPMFGLSREKGEVAAAAPNRGYGKGNIGLNAPCIPQRSPRRPSSFTNSPLVPQEERQSLRTGNDFDFGFEKLPTRYSDPRHRR